MNRSPSCRWTMGALLAGVMLAAPACRNLTDGLSPGGDDPKASATLEKAVPGGKDAAGAAAAEKQAPGDRDSSTTTAEANAGGAKTASPAAKDKGAPATLPAGPPVEDRVINALGKDAWTLNIAPPGAKPENAALRWRNPELDELLRTPPAERPDLTAAVDAKLPIVAANAAIVQARWRQGAPIERLDAAVRNSSLRMPLRLAAVEALGLIDTPAAGERIERLLAKYGDAKGEAAANYSPRLHGDLLRLMAVKKPPGQSPCWVAALGSTDAEVRLVTLEAWATSDAELPPAIVELCDDADTRIRGAALRTLAIRRHPKALGELSRFLDDYDLSVRLAAIAGLGDLGGPEARQELERTMRQPGEMVRATAVASLGALGADEAVIAAADDKSWRVRLAVAEVLGVPQGMSARQPREAARLLAQLIVDRSPQVERAAVLATASWPIEMAGPALLDAMSEKAYMVRKAAANQLAQRWHPAADFPVDSPADNRALALDGLRRKWSAEFGAGRLQQVQVPNEAPRFTLDRLAKRWRELAAQERFGDGLSHDAWVRGALEQQASARAAAAAEPAVDVAEVRALSLTVASAADGSADRQSAIDALVKLGGAALPALEQIAIQDQQPLPEAIYLEVLPASQPAFAILQELKIAKPNERWSLMERLAAYMARQPLSPLALARLADLMTDEKEPLVWQSALAALVPDGREPAVRLATMAVGHPTAEVRRRACEYLAQHGAPERAALLEPLLDDQQFTVVLAAVKALEAGGRIDDPSRLVGLLTRPEKPLRLAVASALCRLDAPEGPPALERLAADADADVRRGAARAMGELGAREFAPLLIDLLDDRNDVAQMALASLTKIVGRDMAHDAKDAGPPTTSEKIRRWRKWSEANQSEE